MEVFINSIAIFFKYLIGFIMQETSNNTLLIMMLLFIVSIRSFYLKHIENRNISYETLNLDLPKIFLFILYNLAELLGIFLPILYVIIGLGIL